MVRFHQTLPDRKQRPKNYFARSEQRRLLILVAMLGLVVVMIGKAADPQTWHWLWAADQGAGAEPMSGERSTVYDTRVRPKSPVQLPLDTFIAQAEPQTKAGTSDFPAVDSHLLDDVEDLTPKIEWDAWTNLAEVVRGGDERSMERASTGHVGFVQLYEQPDQYRGELVTVRGIVKRAFDLTAPKNEQGITTYYQLWLFPEGGPMSPVVVHCLELPEDFPTSRLPNREVRNIHEPAAVTGFFLKNWAYSTGEQLLSAPLLVAKTVKWQQPEVTQIAEPPSFELLGALMAIAAFVGVAIAVWVYRTSKKIGAPPAGLAERFQTTSLDGLKNEDLGPDVGESLRSLAEDEQASSDSYDADKPEEAT